MRTGGFVSVCREKSEVAALIWAEVCTHSSLNKHGSCLLVGLLDLIVFTVCLASAAPMALASSNAIRKGPVQVLTSAGAKLVTDVWQAICHQLGTSSLEDLGLEHTDNLSWKTAEGLAQQQRCYALLGVLDLCFSHQLPKLLDATTQESLEETSETIQCIIDSRSRLHSWLQHASRPKVLNGVHCCLVCLVGSALITFTGCWFPFVELCAVRELLQRGQNGLLHRCPAARTASQRLDAMQRLRWQRPKRQQLPRRLQCCQQTSKVPPQLSLWMRSCSAAVQYQILGHLRYRCSHDFATHVISMQAKHGPHGSLSMAMFDAFDRLPWRHSTTYVSNLQVYIAGRSNSEQSARDPVSPAMPVLCPQRSALRPHTCACTARKPRGPAVGLDASARGKSGSGTAGGRARLAPPVETANTHLPGALPASAGQTWSSRFEA